MWGFVFFQFGAMFSRYGAREEEEEEEEEERGGSEYETHVYMFLKRFFFDYISRICDWERKRRENLHTRQSLHFLFCIY